jgi:O-acetyl-ADP-ribose deacetylase (regulator of RNase III)
MIEYIAGDATQPIGDGVKIIPHICNNVGLWGAGFVLSLSSRWSQPEAAYRAGSMQLGRTSSAWVTPDIMVINMIAQSGVRSTNNPHPLSYGALSKTLDAVGKTALHYQASVHMPKIGAGLAGGDWSKIKAIIAAQVCALGVRAVVYGEDTQ